MTEYKPWDTPEQKIEDALPKRKTVEVDEGVAALEGIREKMGKVLKKDQALKISMAPSKQQSHDEGETWTDAYGKKWIKQDGVAKSSSPLEAARRPWFCPQCSKLMKGKADDRMWLLRSKCHACVVTEETQMRLEGRWEEYQRNIMNANAVAMLKDTINELRGYQQLLGNPQIHFADGRWEEWKIGTDQIKADLQEEINKLEQRLQELQDE